MTALEETDFGQLRSLMHVVEFGPRDRARLVKLATRVATMAPHTYRDQWIPYMQGFEGHWREPMAECVTVEELDRLADLLPMACFTLALHYDGLSEEFERLTRSPAASCLHTLKSDHGALMDMEVKRLIATGRLGKLRHWSMKNNMVGNFAMIELARQPASASLRALRMPHNKVRFEGTEALAHSSYLDGLLVLDLSGNDLSRRGMKCLVQGPSLGGLEALYLSENYIHDQGIEALANAPQLVNVRELYLSRNGITREGIAMLCESDYVRHIEVLDLSHNPLGAAGLDILCHSALLANVRDLSLGNCDAHSQGIEHVMSSPYLGALERLSISGNLGVTRDTWRHLERWCEEHDVVMDTTSLFLDTNRHR